MPEDHPDPPESTEPDEPVDPHAMPFDNEDDARFLDPADPRRIEVERRRGQPFDQEA
jgi:hypothetical protein